MRNENPKWQSFSKYLADLSSQPKSKESSSPSTERFFVRDLSWLQFNERVLSEAADPSVPPLERLRFAGIMSSNLDEFFMVRVAEISRLAKRQPNYRFPFGLHPAHLLGQIREQVLRQKSRQAVVLKDILSALRKEGIHIFSEFDQDRSLDEEIRRNLPDIKLLMRRFSEPFPSLMSDRIHVFVRFPDEYAIISIPDRASRLIHLSAINRVFRFALLDRWLAARAPDFFPGKEVIEALPFKIIRDADLRYRPDEEDTLEEQIVQAVNRRLKAKVIRLEVDSPAYSEGALYLATTLGLDPASLYRFDLPLDLRTLLEIYRMQNLEHLRYPEIRPVVPKPLAKAKDLLGAIRRGDILLHHPYDSFDVIVDLLKQAAKDPSVTHISHTLYRTSKESPIMEALKDGARNGKKVTVYVEIKARFDELNNVRWSTMLRHSGVRVVRPMTNFKVHCKLTQILRTEEGQEVSYLHLGTGNYHPGTARLYTDLGLLTRDPDLGREITSYFGALIDHGMPSELKELMVAPLNLHKQFLKLIREEVHHHQESGGGHIIAKMNSLADTELIEALYEASNAGVKIELIVRGICCLRPGIKGMSENIRVFSVIDRFLEHSRVYYFRAGGAGKVYLSSADWMPRNFHSRYEIAFPVKDAVLKRYIREVILANSLADNVKAWTLGPDGRYLRETVPDGVKPVRSQFVFEELARKHYAGTVLAERKIPMDGTGPEAQPSAAVGKKD